MAVYVISDIHGALAALQKLLKKARIDLAGGDELFLLGDYIDWGVRSMETLLFVMRLTQGETAEHVHCLLGNHEEMFLHTIREHRVCPEDRKETILSSAMMNWVHTNSGIRTWMAYLDMEEAQREEIAAWLEALPLSAEAVLPDGRVYLMGHAYPYFPDMDHFPEDAERERQDAVWRRLLLREDPFADYRGARKYEAFICGHTISARYHEEARGDRQFKGRRPRLRRHNTVFFGERFIDIDCGAKLLDVRDHADPRVREAAEKARLACLRLDDGKVFYAD